MHGQNHIKFAIHCNKQYLTTHETKPTLRDMRSSGKKSRFLNPWRWDR